MSVRIDQELSPALYQAALIASYELRENNPYSPEIKAHPLWQNGLTWYLMGQLLAEELNAWQAMSYSIMTTGEIIVDQSMYDCFAEGYNYGKDNNLPLVEAPKDKPDLAIGCRVKYWASDLLGTVQSIKPEADDKMLGRVVYVVWDEEEELDNWDSMWESDLVVVS